MEAADNGRIGIKLAVSTKRLVLMFRKEKYLMMIERSPAPVWGFDMCIAENEVWVFHGKLNALFGLI